MQSRPPLATALVSHIEKRFSTSSSRVKRSIIIGLSIFEADDRITFGEINQASEIVIFLSKINDDATIDYLSDYQLAELLYRLLKCDDMKAYPQLRYLMVDGILEYFKSEMKFNTYREAVKRLHSRLIGQLPFPGTYSSEIEEKADIALHFLSMWLRSRKDIALKDMSKADYELQDFNDRIKHDSVADLEQRTQTLMGSR